MNLPKGGTGKLTQRVTLQEATWEQSESGAEESTWADVSGGTLWASVLPLSGNELVQAQQVVADVTIKVVTRFYPGITTQHRWRFGTRYLNIGAVLNFEERGDYLTTLCSEKPE